MFEVLMYLFENYMTEGTEFEPDQETLSAELLKAGFDDGEISKAFTWLEDLSQVCEQTPLSESQNAQRSIRHLASAEIAKFDMPARGLLLSLEQAGVLDPLTRELVIERAMALGTDQIDAEHLKWVVMMVLCNQPGRDDVCAWAEALVMDGENSALH